MKFEIVRGKRQVLCTAVIFIDGGCGLAMGVKYNQSVREARKEKLDNNARWMFADIWLIKTLRETERAKKT